MELATVYVRKYQNDVFFHTETNIVALQVAYAGVILLFSVSTILFLYHEILGEVGALITTALTTSIPISGSRVLAELEAVRTREVVSVSLLICAATAVFGYLVSRLALTPARNALTAQKEFIGNIAHELRTPLTIIKANTELLLLEESAKTATHNTLLSNVEELDRVSDIINNLLSLNVLVQPERVSFGLVDIPAIFRRVLANLSRPTREKSINIKTRFVGECSVWGNATALEQIVTNLLKNALQHTQAGEIAITVGPDAQGLLELSVRDTGTGIKQEDLFRIFEPFYRGDRARTRGGGVGSGLGLTIVSELVKLHKGRVSVRSAPKQGTTVTVTLPRGEHLPKTEPRRVGMNEVCVDFSNGRKQTR